MSSTRFETIIYEKSGPLARLTMNRPERLNGMTNRMLIETRSALEAASEDRELRILVLTGAGKGFCPGADIGQVASAAPDDKITVDDFRVPILLHDMPAVTIAAVNGACAGAGLGWALACDFRFAAESARFNVAFLDVGVAGDMGGPWSLARIVGPARARELYFLPGKFDAAEALSIGLVTRVFPDDRFRDEVETIVNRLADSAPIALRTLKANFVASERMDFAGYVALETERHIRMFQTEDTREAFAAKAQKRKPQFKGRRRRTTMWLRLRQIALVAHKLAPIAQDMHDVFGLEVGFRDPGVKTFGLENALFPVGNQFIEVVSPIQENTAGGRYLDRRRGDGGYMVICQCDEHAPRKARVAELGIRKVMESDGHEYSVMQLHPRDTGGSFLEIDFQKGGEDINGPWEPAGKDFHKAIRTDIVRGIAAAEIQTPDPKDLAERWSRIIEIPVKPDKAGNPSIRLENATIRFVKDTDGRGEGLGGLDLLATNRTKALEAAARLGKRTSDGTIQVCGMRMNLVDA